MNKSILIILVISLLFFGCKKNELPQYNLLKTSEDILIDGNLNESSWQKANLIEFKLNDTGGSIDNSAFLTTGKGWICNKTLYD